MLPPTKFPEPGSVTLPTLSNVYVKLPAAMVVLAPVPMKLPADMLPVTSKLPVTLAPLVVAAKVMVPLGASYILPAAPVMIDSAPVSTILPVKFKLPAPTLPV